MKKKTASDEDVACETEEFSIGVVLRGSAADNLAYLLDAKYGAGWRTLPAREQSEKALHVIRAALSIVAWSDADRVSFG